jgi:hypothetical protein
MRTKTTEVKKRKKRNDALRANQKNMVLRTERNRKRNEFDTGQRAFAIARVLDDDIPVAQAAEEVGAAPGTVYGWIYKTIEDSQYTDIRLGKRHSKYYRIKDS